MKPEIIFTDNSTINSLLANGKSYVALTSNLWNDRGYCTKFEVKLVKDKQFYAQPNRKVLFLGQTKDEESHLIFRKKINSDGYVNIKSFDEYRNFISIGNDYEEIKKVFPEHYEEILKTLNDITLYLDEGEPIDSIEDFTSHPAFKISLLREQSFKKAYEDLKIESINKNKTGDQVVSIEPQFKFDLKLGERHYKYNFNFSDKNNLPHRINLLIGKNGTGKSQTLKYIAKYLMFQEDKHVSVEEHPNFIQNLMVFAYNPYEDFYMPEYKDEKKKALLIKYKYVGLKNREKDNTILFNPEYPKIKSYKSFMNLLEKDVDNFHTKNEKMYEVSYIEQIIGYLKKSDESISGFALKFKEDTDTQKYQPPLTISRKPEGNFIFIKPSIEGIDNYKLFIKKELRNDFESEIYFYNEQEHILNLSSGQKIFTYLVINLLSMIKENSLILIDEPETALHPNLEISFMKILKSILDKNKSYAIIATHSSIVTREIPDKFVHVISIKNTTDVIINKPIMRTFGSNIGDITNYIFDDVFQEEKPYQEWLESQKESYSNYQEFHERIGKTLSYEILTEAKKMWLQDD